MTRDQVKSLLERVLTWPPKRQEDLVRVIERMQEQDGDTLRLTEEQAGEIRRRLASPASERVPSEDVFKRIRSSGA